MRKLTAMLIALPAALMLTSCAGAGDNPTVSGSPTSSATPTEGNNGSTSGPNSTGAPDSTGNGEGSSGGNNGDNGTGGTGSGSNSDDLLNDGPLTDGAGAGETRVPSNGTGLLHPLIPIVDENLLKYCPDMAAVSYKGGINPENVSIYVCHSAISEEGTETAGYYLADVQQRSRILNAYAAPSAKPNPNAECPEDAVDPLIIWVENNNTKEITALRAPVDSCGLPQEKPTQIWVNLQLTDLPVN